MKIQDIVFFVIFGLLIYKHNSKWFAVAGIISLMLSTPLQDFLIELYPLKITVDFLDEENYFF